MKIPGIIINNEGMFMINISVDLKTTKRSKSTNKSKNLKKVSQNKESKNKILNTLRLLLFLNFGTDKNDLFDMEIR